MQIEVARIYRVSNGSLKAFIDVVLDGQVLVKGLKIFASRDGDLSLKMPSGQAKNGKWYPTVKILDDELNQELQERVLEAYHV